MTTLVLFYLIVVLTAFSAVCLLWGLGHMVTRFVGRMVREFVGRGRPRREA